MAYLGRVLVIRIDERLTPDAFERFLGELGRAIELRWDNKLCGVIYDIPCEISLDAVRRRRVAEVLSERASLVASMTVGLALASPSKLTRGVLEAIFWMSPPSYAHTAVNTVPEALEFLRQFLPEVEPEEYAFEYRRLLARNGALASGIRPAPVLPPPSSRSCPSSRS